MRMLPLIYILRKSGMKKVF